MTASGSGSWAVAGSSRAAWPRRNRPSSVGGVESGDLGGRIERGIRAALAHVGTTRDVRTSSAGDRPPSSVCRGLRRPAGASNTPLLCHPPHRRGGLISRAADTARGARPCTGERRRLQPAGRGGVRRLAGVGAGDAVRRLAWVGAGGWVWEFALVLACRRVWRLARVAPGGRVWKLALACRQVRRVARVGAGGGVRRLALAVAGRGPSRPARAWWR